MREPEKVVIDTSTLFQEGKMAMLRKLEAAKIIKLYLSSETVEHEYGNKFEEIWKNKHEAEFKRLGVPLAQQERKMSIDREAMDKIVYRIEVVEVTREEIDAERGLFKDKSDSFLAATAKKAGASYIVSSDGNAPDVAALEASGFKWRSPDEFLAEQARDHAPEVHRALRKERIPASLPKLKEQIDYNLEQARAGMVFIPAHVRSGIPVTGHWRNPRDAAAYKEEVMQERGLTAS